MRNNRYLYMILGGIIFNQGAVAEGDTAHTAAQAQAVEAVAEEAVHQAEAYLQHNPGGSSEENAVAAEVEKVVEEVKEELASGVPMNPEQQLILTSKAEFLALASGEREVESNPVAEKIESVEETILN